MLIGNILQRQPFRIQLRKVFDTGENIGNLIPGCLINDTGWIQLKNLLKGNHGILRIIIEITIDIANFRNGRIVVRNAVKLHLNGADIISGITKCQRKARIGRCRTLNGCIPYQLNIGSIVIGQNIICTHSLLGKINGSPLRKSLTGNRGSIAKCGKQWLYCPRSAYIYKELLIHQTADIFKDFSAVYVLLVILRGTGNIKRISTGTVPLCINSVECKCRNHVDIGTQRGFRPSRVDFAGCNVLHIIGKGNGHVLCILVRTP